jgi:hypothetical protein
MSEDVIVGPEATFVELPPPDKLWTFWMYGNIANTVNTINDKYPTMPPRIVHMSYDKNATVVVYCSPVKIHD